MMRLLTYFLLISFSFTSCQKDKFISEDLNGEWKYERDLSETFDYLLDFDKSGTMSFHSDAMGEWNNDMGFSNFRIEWTLDEEKQTVDIVKYDQNMNIVCMVKYNLTQINDNNIELLFEKFKVSALSPKNLILQFDHINLTRK